MKRRRSGSGRSVGWLALIVAMVLGAVLPLARAAAQDATPAASPVGEVISSGTREEVRAQIEAEYTFEEVGSPGGTLVDSGVSDIQTLNPLLVEETVSNLINGLIYDTLIGGNPRTGAPAPLGLADSWEIAADGITYTFALNQEATWHDGEDVTADDVVFSLDALADEATLSTYTGTFNATVASYRAIDEHTVEIVATDRLVSVLYDLLSVWVVPQHIWESIPHAEWKEHPISTGQDTSGVIGSGPFRFEEWVQGESITVVRNDDYYDVVPNIERYTYLIWQDSTAIVNALLNSEIDLAGLEPTDVETVEAEDFLNLEIYDTRSFIYYEFNLDAEVTTKWQDQEVRQALAYAIDRQAIVDDILLGYSTVARGTQPTISYAYAPERIETDYTFDPDRARQLLEQAGWTDTNDNGTVDKDGQELEFEFLYPSGSPSYDQIVAYLQDAWSEIGVSMEPRALEFTALIEATTTTPTFEVALYGFNWDATFIQDAMFGCEQYQVGFNDMRYCNPRVDELNEQAKREFDQEARAEILIEVSNVVNEEQPILVMTFDQAIAAWNTRVHNYFPGPWGGPGIAYIWLEE